MSGRGQRNLGDRFAVWPLLASSWRNRGCYLPMRRQGCHRALTLAVPSLTAVPEWTRIRRMAFAKLRSSQFLGDALVIAMPHVDPIGPDSTSRTTTVFHWCSLVRWNPHAVFNDNSRGSMETAASPATGRARCISITSILGAMAVTEHFAICNLCANIADKPKGLRFPKRWSSIAPCTGDRIRLIVMKGYSGKHLRATSCTKQGFP